MDDERPESAATLAASARESLVADQRLTWTIPEAARLLGISKDSAYEAAHRGELPVRVIGRRLLIPALRCCAFSTARTRLIATSSRSAAPNSMGIPKGR
jgi:excisionase family DNA binding protein